MVPFGDRMLQDPATEPCATFCATNLKEKVGAACRAPWPNDVCLFAVCALENSLCPGYTRSKTVT